MVITAKEHASEAPAVFECRNLAIDFNTPQGLLTVLEKVSFQVGRGEFVSIVGGSGTGKTTLLRILGGLAAPRPGSIVEYHGKAVVTPPEGVAFVFQDYRGSLLPWRNVRRNVELGIEAGSLSRRDRQQRAREVLALVGLDQRSADYPSRLSGGMQQRVQIARALAMQPEVLLMDEPFGALDAMTKAGLQDEMLRLHQITGTTVLFVTHDIEEAVYLSDRVVVLSHTPARIASEIAIDLPRPRHQIATRAMPEYLALRQSIHSSIGHP
jgi:NitT/TauT family transport system ATP-binding protein